MYVATEVAAGACALLFLAAAVGKLDRWTQWSALAETIPGPNFVGHIARLGVPMIEVVVVVLSFMVPIAGLAGGAIVLVFFAVGVGLLARRLPGRDCNCFGVIAPAAIGHRLVARNVGLAILAAAGWYGAREDNLRALSFSKVLMTLLTGGIALMLVQYRRLHQVARPTSPMAKEAE